MHQPLNKGRLDGDDAGPWRAAKVNADACQAVVEPFLDVPQHGVDLRAAAIPLLCERCGAREDNGTVAGRVCPVGDGRHNVVVVVLLKRAQNVAVANVAACLVEAFFDNVGNQIREGRLLGGRHKRSGTVELHNAAGLAEQQIVHAGIDDGGVGHAAVGDHERDGHDVVAGRLQAQRVGNRPEQGAVQHVVAVGPAVAPGRNLVCPIHSNASAVDDAGLSNLDMRRNCCQRCQRLAGLDDDGGLVLVWVS